MAHLVHPFIARLLDGGTTEDGLPYLVMEHIDGAPIDKYCDSNNLSIRERLKLFLKVCTGVAFAHRNLIVHRDLKPNNILVTHDGEPKILDFGIAKLLAPNTNEETTKSGGSLMTPQYASPEQLLGLDISIGTDIYTLGLLLYELLSGLRPYELRSIPDYKMLRLVIEKDLVLPSSAVRRATKSTKRHNASKELAARSEARAMKPEGLIRILTGDLDAIVSRVLRVAPEERYATADSLAEDIRRHLSGHPVLARKPSSAYKLRKLIGRNKLGVAAFSLILISLALLVNAGLTQLKRIREAQMLLSDLTITLSHGSDTARSILRENNCLPREVDCLLAFNRRIRKQTFISLLEIEHAKQTIAGHPRSDLRHLNLSGLNLNGMNLSHVDLSNALLRKTQLEGANLQGASFSHAVAVEANLSSAELGGADLFGADLTDSDFSGADLRDASFQQATLDGANFEGADLSRANFSGVDLSAALNLEQAQLNVAFGDSETQLEPTATRPSGW